MEPILHLSVPVRDLAESAAFYVDVLGCDVGRVRAEFADVWFFGLQLTLHAEPAQVQPPEARGVRHFGVTLTGDELSALLDRVEEHGVTWLDPVATDHPGTPLEQTKAKLLDPNGYAIELKAYANPAAALLPGSP